MGKYRIESVLNRGGFGCVYRALQLELNRAVAIKVLQPASRVGFQDDSAAEAKRLEVVTRRFEREAQLVSQLRDPNTVMMYDFGHTPSGLLYMVLEFVDGAPLNDVLETQGAVGPERAVKIIRQVLSSLQEAHAFNMLHRDIKPGNIMLFNHVGRTDQVKVLDFGLAKAIDDPHFTADNPDLTDAEVLIGTPRYMSPEQIRGHRLSPTTDIYSLGLVFYELLTGEKAVDSKSTMNTLARHVNDEPIVLPGSLDIPNGLRNIVNRMLEKDTKRRLQSAEEVLRLLEAWNSKEVLVPLSASMLSDDIEIVEVVKAPGWLWGAGATAIALVVIGFGMLMGPGEEETPEPVVIVQPTIEKTPPSTTILEPVIPPKVEEVEIAAEVKETLEEDPEITDTPEEVEADNVNSNTTKKAVKVDRKTESNSSKTKPENKSKLPFLKTMDSNR